MAELKTQKNDRNVEAFGANVADDQRREDCLAVLELMKQLTGEPAVMWGKTIVGFGSFHYRGKTTEGDWFPVGFSPRKQNLTLYLHCVLEKQTALEKQTVLEKQTALLEKLGPHRIGKSCLYVKKLADVHIPTLKNLIERAYKSPSFG